MQKEKHISAVFIEQLFTIYATLENYFGYLGKLFRLSWTIISAILDTYPGHLWQHSWTIYQ